MAQSVREQDTASILRAREALYRAQRDEAETLIRDQASTLKKPPFFGYFFLFYLAIIVDIFSVVELIADFVFGAGLVLGPVINIFTGIIFVASAIFISRRIKRMERLGERFGNFANRISQNVVRQRAASSPTTGQSPARRNVVRFRRYAKAVRSPVLKMIFASVAEIIWVLDLLPWQTWGVYTTYRDHKETYRDGMERLEHCREAIAAQDEEFALSQALIARQSDFADVIPS